MESQERVDPSQQPTDLGDPSGLPQQGAVPERQDHKTVSEEEKEDRGDREEHWLMDIVAKRASAMTENEAESPTPPSSNTTQVRRRPSRHRRLHFLRPCSKEVSEHVPCCGTSCTALASAEATPKDVPPGYGGTPGSGYDRVFSHVVKPTKDSVYSSGYSASQDDDEKCTEEERVAQALHCQCPTVRAHQPGQSDRDEQLVSLLVQPPPEEPEPELVEAFLVGEDQSSSHSAHAYSILCDKLSKAMKVPCINCDHDTTIWLTNPSTISTTCDGCSLLVLAMDEPMFGCRLCNYHLCMDCVMKLIRGRHQSLDYDEQSSVMDCRPSATATRIDS